MALLLYVSHQLWKHGGHKGRLRLTGSPRCRPAFKVAAACKEIEADRDGEEDPSPFCAREGSPLAPFADMLLRGCWDCPASLRLVERESVFRSGAIRSSYVR